MAIKSQNRALNTNVAPKFKLAMDSFPDIFQTAVKFQNISRCFRKVVTLVKAR